MTWIYLYFNTAEIANNTTIQAVIAYVDPILQIATQRLIRRQYDQKMRWLSKLHAPTEQTQINATNVDTNNEL